MPWYVDHRPGYFGRQRDARIRAMNERYGEGKWRLVWQFQTKFGVEYLSFEEACKRAYEESYYLFLKDRPREVDFITEFVDCIDNAETNVQSGRDYTKQEAFSTHIQDIAVRNVLHRLWRPFTGKNGRLLVIRSADSEGYRFGPGNVPFFAPEMIRQPLLHPRWAGATSVESYWQSNKHVQVFREA